jgi:hypothetical protein
VWVDIQNINIVPHCAKINAFLSIFIFISVAAVLGFNILFNTGFGLARSRSTTSSSLLFPSATTLAPLASAAREKN